MKPVFFKMEKKRKIELEKSASNDKTVTKSTKLDKDKVILIEEKAYNRKTVYEMDPLFTEFGRKQQKKSKKFVVKNNGITKRTEKIVMITRRKTRMTMQPKIFVTKKMKEILKLQYLYSDHLG